MIVCIDLETTGLDNKKDEIIEIAMVKFDEKTFKIVSEYNCLVNPGIKIPDLISNITGINDSDVDGAPAISDLKHEILDFIGDYPILGHNIPFDRNFLIQNGCDIRNNICLDTFFLANFLCINNSSLNLEMLSTHFGKPFSGAHRALNDVMATIEVFKNLVKTFEKLPKYKKELYYYIFDKSDDTNVEYLREYLFSEFPLKIDNQKYEKTILKYVKKFDSDREIVIDELSETKVSEVFNNIKDTETRYNQMKMSEMVLDNLSNKGKKLIEAPTGLGKTFAYLIPSILHSIKTGEKVYVSTKTKNLQDQIFEKDLESLKNCELIDFNFSKLKGKRNYISIYNFFEQLIYDDFSYSKTNLYLKITSWLLETEHGELDEITFYGEEYSFLRSINAENNFVLSSKNTYRNYEFLYKTRKALESSNIVVINHSILFSDIKSETGFLGNIENLVVDEAHNIEDSVTESLRKKLNFKGFGDFLDGIEKVFNKKGLKKLNYLNSKDKLEQNISLISDYVYSYVDSKVGKDQKYKTILIKDDLLSELNFNSIISKIELEVISIIDILSNIDEHDFSKEKSSLEYYLDILKTVFNESGIKSNICIGHFDDRQGISIEYTLLNPGNYLKDKVWKNVDSVLLTSATLSIGGSFDYFKNILSLDDFSFDIFESDFDYSRQASLFVLDDLGSIKSNSFEVIRFLSEFYSLVGGKTLTLLTSFNIIRKIYTSLNVDLKKKNINLLAQSIGGSKAKLLNTFNKESEKSILLGTDSFWEGVDIPGNNLKFLVIHKMPFMVPTDPIFMARSQFFSNPFIEYSLPKSIIKLKQGFGRLIRSKKDSGVVVVLDDRIYSTRWGESFYSSFPSNINKKKVSSKSFLEILK